MTLPAEKTRYTFADCLTWDENEHIEIIDGKAFMMATPSRIHQEISFEIRYANRARQTFMCGGASAAGRMNVYYKNGHISGVCGAPSVQDLP